MKERIKFTHGQYEAIGGSLFYVAFVSGLLAVAKCVVELIDIVLRKIGMSSVVGFVLLGMLCIVCYITFACLLLFVEEKENGDK